jgi:hypothetical protein
LVDFWLARSSSAAAFLSLSMAGNFSDCGGRSLAVGFFCPLRPQGIGDAGAGFPYAVFGAWRTLSLCAESHVRGGRGGIVGQGLSLGDVQVLEYAVLPWLAAHLFVVFYEEPTLRCSFGAEYETYRANVPRWIPRLSAWQGAERYSI